MNDQQYRKFVREREQEKKRKWSISRADVVGLGLIGILVAILGYQFWTIIAQNPLPSLLVALVAAVLILGYLVRDVIF